MQYDLGRRGGIKNRAHVSKDGQERRPAMLRERFGHSCCH